MISMGPNKKNIYGIISGRKWTLTCIFFVFLIAYMLTHRFDVYRVFKLSKMSITTIYEADYMVIDDRLAIYVRQFKTTPDTKSLLDNYLGNIFLEAESGIWYYPLDRHNLKWMIFQDANDNLLLYKFEGFVVEANLSKDKSEWLEDIKEQYPAATNFLPYNLIDEIVMIRGKWM